MAILIGIGQVGNWCFFVNRYIHTQYTQQSLNSCHTRQTETYTNTFVHTSAYTMQSLSGHWCVHVSQECVFKLQKVFKITFMCAVQKNNRLSAEESASWLRPKRNSKNWQEIQMIHLSVCGGSAYAAGAAFLTPHVSVSVFVCVAE